MQLYNYLVRHVIVMLLFPYMTSFLMTTCERLISETTINRNNCKTMSNIETKFGGSWIFLEVFSSVNCMYCILKIVMLHGRPNICVQAEIDLWTARPPVLVVMIYASLARTLIIIWKPYRSILILLTNYRTRWWW